MDEHLLKNIQIKDFKCFKNFKADGFKRVNLIGGKNNVGKTAFMEACYINTYPYESTNSSSMALSDIVFTRYNQVILQDLLLEKGNLFIAKEIEKKVIEFNKASLVSNIFDTLLKYKEGDLGLRDKEGLVKYFLGNNQITNDKLEESYGKIIELEKEKEIDELIRNIDSSIKSFRIINSQPKCNFIDNSTFVDIHELGDGLYKYISILLSLFICHDSYLFIDEIDNGIHYSNLDKLWEIILKVSREKNVQVFATTHSKECIESYARVSKKFEDEDMTYIKMSRLEDGTIKAGVRDYEMFQDTLDDEHEIR